MFLTRCRKRLFQQVTRGTEPRCFAYTTWAFSSSSNRVLRRPTTTSSTRAALWTPRRFQPVRSNSTPTPSSNSSFAPRFDEEGNDSYLSDSDADAIIARVQKAWPSPPSHLIPPGWSSTWSNWPYLLTYYWLGPYYLMLPQIEMLVNIKHRIPGETRPILFSTTNNAFIFTLVEDETKLFYADGEKGEVWRFEGVHGEHELVSVMSQEGGEEKVKKMLNKVTPDGEGQNVLTRILERDETVIPVLADKFLDYTPIKSMPWEEGGFVGDVQVSEEEEVELLNAMVKEAEEYAGKHGIVGMEDKEGNDLAEEEEQEEEELEPDKLEQEVDAALRNFDRLRGVDMEDLERVAAEEDEQDRQKREGPRANLKDD